MRRYYPLFLLMLLSIACEQQEISSLSTDSVYLDKNVISLTDARQIADSFCLQSGRIITKSEDNDPSDFSFTAEDGTCYAHCINMPNGGFVIVASDRRMGDVLGYGEDGEILEDKSNYPEGFLEWLDMIDEQHKYVVDNDSSIIEKIPQTKSAVLDSSAYEPHDITVGPLITDSWIKEAPYNQNMPATVDSCGTLYRTPDVSSGAIAIAKIMRYHQKPSSFSWNTMPIDTVSNSLLQLLSYLHDNIDMAVSFETAIAYARYYISDGDFDVPDFMSEEGYMNAIQQDYSTNSTYSIVESELLDHSRPVLFSAKAEHSNGFYSNRYYWVCDGARSREVVEDVDGEEYIYRYLYFHHNWGTRVFSNAWLGYLDFQPDRRDGAQSSKTFNIGMRIVHHIY